MTHPDTCVQALIDALGTAVTTDPGELDRVRADKSGQQSGGSPAALVNARSVEDVQATLRIASAHRRPVVPRGAGTGLSGGAIGDSGEIVLSVAAMDRILEINPVDELAVVQPGIINQALNDALAPHNLWFAPDPASKAISTVGGNIATNAGGLLCAKYGVTREAVLALKVVTADGTLLQLGRRSVKGVTGLDVTALMIGSEGILGVIVEATVKLRPLPPGGKTTLGGYFASIETASAACTEIIAAGLRPAVLELLDATALEAISRHLELGESASGRPYLLVQFDEFNTEDRGQQCLEILRAAGGEVELTTDDARSEHLFGIRRAFHAALEKQGAVLIEDVAVPRSALPAMFAEIRRISEKHGVPIPTVAHAADGNLHPNFVFEASTAEIGAPDGVPERIWMAAHELFSAAMALGGTLTGEHGVGLLKRRWVEQELGPELLEIQRQIKHVFDPLGILNPGKAI